MDRTDEDRAEPGPDELVMWATLDGEAMTAPTPFTPADEPAASAGPTPVYENWGHGPGGAAGDPEHALLSDEEKRALAERAEGRFADPAYRQRLGTGPTALTDEELAEWEGALRVGVRVSMASGFALRLIAEVERLRSFLVATLDHGTTLWSDTSCGGGGGGGQTMTTTAHPEVIQHLISSAFQGRSLAEAADDYAAWVPNTARLDEKPRRARRRGPDGRPV